ncbi:MAG: diguanylate cyclase [Campylobacterota bacterium]|nr:diguanylate cyclase [Campylobacterota bacterium]
MADKKMILIIEDDPLSRDSLLIELKKYKGFEAIFTQTYNETMKTLRARHKEVDFAIADLNLPDAKGNQIIQLIRSHKIPAIAFSAHMDSKLRDIIFEKGIIDYVLKSNKNSVPYAIKRIDNYLKKHTTKILIADDSKLYRQKAIEALENIDIEIIECEDGAEALKYMKKENHGVSLILTDYQMPNMDGLELTMNVRALYNKDEVSIITMSTIDDRATITKFLKVGANDYLIKPFNNDEILLKVQSHLEIAELFERSKDLANKDFLSGAYNRRYFFESGNAIMEKNRRKKQDLAVAMVDIDFFKKINDTYGHETGDVAIKETIYILKQNLRNSDLIARFGGEEFAILLEDISLQNVEVLFEKVRAAFEANVLSFNNNEIKFTVSIGVYYGAVESLDKAIALCDEELYKAKETGRNKVQIALG